LKFKTINFDSIANLKKIKNIEYCWSSLSLTEFRKARIALKNENYDNPEYYDSDYEYYAEENENYKKNWSRMTEINSEYWDWYSLESRFIDLEKKENKKKFEKKTIIQKKKN
jgi:tryptophan 2,3-dioxygenase